MNSSPGRPMWQGILGHDDVVERFRRALCAAGWPARFCSSVPRGSANTALPCGWHRRFSVSSRPIEKLDPCGECESCVQARAGVHPDLLRVARPADKSFIPLSLLIGDDQHRMRAGLCHDIAMQLVLWRPQGGDHRRRRRSERRGGQRAIKNVGGAAAGERADPGWDHCRQTVADDPLAFANRSFPRLDPAAIAQLLLAQGLVPSLAEGERLAALAEGSLSRAAELADDELIAFRIIFWPSSAGSIAAAWPWPARRANLSMRRGRKLRRVGGGCGKSFAWPSNIIAAACVPQRSWLPTACRPTKWRPTTGGALTEQTQRSLEGLGQVDRNAHQATLIDCWLDDLCQLEAGRNAAAEGDG